MFIDPRRIINITGYYLITESFLCILDVQIISRMWSRGPAVQIIFVVCKVCSKSVETEAVLSKTQMNNEWNINFLQNRSFGIQYTYSSEFSVGQKTSETQLLVCETVLLYYFDILYILKYNWWCEFSIEETKSHTGKAW